MEITEYERLIPNCTNSGITFLTPNSQCVWRVDTLLTKEPDTIAWIEKMLGGEMLFDIGANMGQYSLYAAVKRSITVHAFEPEAQNFSILCRNVALNKLQDKITPWPLALSDKAEIAEMHLSSCMPGGSCHSFGESKDYHGNPKAFPFKQGSVSTTLDKFSEKYGIPDHIKIDVDGFEHLVIKGGAGILPKVKSVLIEINTRYKEHVELIEYMKFRNFHFDPAQAESSRRKEGAFEGVGNIIFYRD